jgi:2-dehydro-3-deoxygalactonokinase
MTLMINLQESIMQNFISCDWGTSTLRLRLVDAVQQTVRAEVTDTQGIFDTYKLWKQEALDEAKRLSFYQSVVRGQLEKLEQQLAVSLRDVPLIISGMASSSIGMVELSYKELPWVIYRGDLEFKMVKKNEDFRHDMVLVSGVKSANDVMRGEETQLIGCELPLAGEQIFIFPGTHSKHVYVEQRTVLKFKTYMTGEFFSLLSKQSTLSDSVTETNFLSKEARLKSFEKGVDQCHYDNLLHNAFLARTNYLLGHLTQEENYLYLSGLLIGTELKDLVNCRLPLTIVSNESMRTYYAAALEKLGIHDFETQDVDNAIVKGHCKIYRLLQEMYWSGKQR